MAIWPDTTEGAGALYAGRPPPRDRLRRRRLVQDHRPGTTQGWYHDIL